MTCRFCQAPLTHVFIDLFNAPASNSFLKEEQLSEPEVFYPLKVYVCDRCFLVQVDEYKKSDAIFNSEYVYFSSYSTSWLEHSRRYTEDMVARFGFDSSSFVIEIASNDGYLLQYFKAKGIPVLGIEPTLNTAEIARSKGVDTRVEFFGTALAKQLVAEGVRPNLMLGNNVLAHVPDIVDFVRGMSILLAEDGVITMEFPHLMRLVEHNQFDTIYHEHFSYLSFLTVQQIFAAQGLRLFDVEELPTHGGSLRIYACHQEDKRAESPRVEALLREERSRGMDALPFYGSFQERALQVKLDLTSFLIEQKRAGRKVGAYGAAAKGNTLLNYCGIKQDLIAFVADANPHKQGKFLPASHIPVVSEAVLRVEKPDFVIIFPWNLTPEITKQLSYIKDWGGKFVIPIPHLQVI
jgi:2-polyprenyl-3-methyl-5-hydroxy-6-metoxy-1,4-benzoquinol methylase